MLTQDGIPCIYYGTEQQFEGGNDPNNREDLWNSGYNKNNPTFQWIAALNAARKRYEPLRRGELKFVAWTGDETKGGSEDSAGAGVLGFERFTNTERVLVLINTDDTDWKDATRDDGTSGTGERLIRPMTTGFAPGTTLVNVIDEPDATDEVVVAADGVVTISLPPRGVKVFVPK